MKKIIFILFAFITSGVAFANIQDTITTKSGLKYVQIKAGKGKKPVKGDEVKVHYKLFLPDGTVAEESFGGEPFKFIVGKQEVIPGWDEGFLLLTEGERGIFVIPSALAYGTKGVKESDDSPEYSIPPNTILTFEVKLLKVDKVK